MQSHRTAAPARVHQSRATQTTQATNPDRALSAQAFSWREGPEGASGHRHPVLNMERKPRRALDQAGEASRLESPSTPPMKLSDAEAERGSGSGIKGKERSRVGCGSGPAGLYSHKDYGRGKWKEAFEPCGPGRLTSEMKGINALNLQPATPKGHP